MYHRRRRGHNVAGHLGRLSGQEVGPPLNAEGPTESCQSVATRCSRLKGHGDLPKTQRTCRGRVICATSGWALGECLTGQRPECGVQDLATREFAAVPVSLCRAKRSTNVDAHLLRPSSGDVTLWICTLCLGRRGWASGGLCRRWRRWWWWERRWEAAKVMVETYVLLP